MSKDVAWRMLWISMICFIILMFCSQINQMEFVGIMLLCLNTFWLMSIKIRISYNRKFFL